MYSNTRILATITTITVIIMTILMVGKHEGGEEYGAGGKLQESAPRAPKPRAWRLLPPTLLTTLASSYSPSFLYHNLLLLRLHFDHSYRLQSSVGRDNIYYIKFAETKTFTFCFATNNSLIYLCASGVRVASDWDVSSHKDFSATKTFEHCSASDVTLRWHICATKTRCMALLILACTKTFELMKRLRWVPCALGCYLSFE